MVVRLLRKWKLPTGSNYKLHVRHRLSSSADSDAKSSRKSDRTSDTSSKSRSDSSPRSKNSQSLNREEQRSNSESSFNYNAGVPVGGFRLTWDSGSTSKIVTRRYLSVRGVMLPPMRSRVPEKRPKVKKRPAKKYNRWAARGTDPTYPTTKLAAKLARTSAKSKKRRRRCRKSSSFSLKARSESSGKETNFSPGQWLCHESTWPKSAETSIGSRDVKVTYSKTNLTAGVNVASNTSLETIYWLAEMHKKQLGIFTEKYNLKYVSKIWI